MKEFYMKKALQQAMEANNEDEVPVGAVIVKNNEIIAVGHNTKEADCDATSHAEINAIRNACKRLNSWRLIDCEMYVTLEPCAMCCGAIIQARIEKVYIAAMDPKGGAAGSKLNLLTDYTFNHKCELEIGILENESAALLKEFFRKKRI